MSDDDRADGPPAPKLTVVPPPASPPEGDFANHPMSVTEARADKTRDGSDWTPRDALIDVLRLIDSGKISPHTLIIGYAYQTPGEKPSDQTMGWRASAPSILHSMGVASWVHQRIFEARQAQET